ncbi:MAG: hypothetical protein ABR498_02290 [Candidatus Dormibacteria bacterium]
MATQSAEVWDLWIAGVASLGISFARGRIAPADVVLVHAAPEELSVDVVDDGGALLARGRGLKRTIGSPMARLHRQGDAISREDIWPRDDDVGRPVILAGGEVGILQRWWNADDQSEWRWSIELYNHR